MSREDSAKASAKSAQNSSAQGTKSEKKTAQNSTPLLRVQGLSQSYKLPKEKLFSPAEVKQALIEADFELYSGESLAIIGESGSGKTTLIKAVLALERATSGEVFFNGEQINYGNSNSLHWLRRETGIVFQDPYASLDPRQNVDQIISEPLEALKLPGNHYARVLEVLEQVGLESWRSEQYPHELSGGQRQRVALARAIVHQPSLLVGDEPLSALDVTVRAQILELLARLKSELNLTLILVSHDIALVQKLADKVLVLKSGHIVEQGTVKQILSQPKHPYTKQLLASVPVIKA